MAHEVLVGVLAGWFIGLMAGVAPIMIGICLFNAIENLDMYYEDSAMSFLGATFWSLVIGGFFHWLAVFQAPFPIWELALVSYGFTLLWFLAAIYQFRRLIRPSHGHSFWSSGSECKGRKLHAPTFFLLLMRICGTFDLS
jgi:hypothetical protein